MIDWSKGDEYALEQLMPLVNDELRQMARRFISSQLAGHTFQATKLVHATYVNITSGQEQNWKDRERAVGDGQSRTRNVAASRLRL